MCEYDEYMEYLNENQHEVTIRVYPDMGHAYTVTVTIDGDGDIEDLIDEWMDYSLINVQQWELV